jgi:pimeloyl-ACP methyl ester carboxylesterase
MFFNESEALASQHPELRELIGKIDGQLSQFDATAIARVGDFSTFLGESINRVSGIFERYVMEGVLQKVDMVECVKCQTLSPAGSYRSNLAAEDLFACSACGDDLTSQSPKQFYVYKLTATAARHAARMRPRSQSEIKHVVLLIHGIRTTAVWQEMVAHELEATPGVKVEPLGFEYFDAISFWFPFWTRSKPVRKLLGKIRLAKSLYPQAEFSVIAHSFGTYSVFRILNEQPDLHFKRIILCGSIVSHDAPWASLKPRVRDEIINDCGTRDAWPVAARAFSWFYGATGTFGFKSPGIRDRFHDIDHGGFFSEEFVRRYWVPYITKGQYVPSPVTTTRAATPWLLSFGSSGLFRFLFWTGVLLVLLATWKLAAWLM